MRVVLLSVGCRHLYCVVCIKGSDPRRVMRYLSVLGCRGEMVTRVGLGVEGGYAAYRCCASKIDTVQRWPRFYLERSEELQRAIESKRRPGMMLSWTWYASTKARGQRARDEDRAGDGANVLRGENEL